MSIYDSCKSGIIQRGEELFPFIHFGTGKDYLKIQYVMEKIPRGGERLMGTGEIIQLYD